MEKKSIPVVLFPLLSYLFAITEKSRIEIIPHSHLIFPRESFNKSVEYPEFLSLQEEILLDTAKIIVSAPFEQRECNLAYLNNKWLCVWVDFREYYDPLKLTGIFERNKIYGTFIIPDGTSLTPLNFLISNNYGGVAYPFTAGGVYNFLVVWQDYRQGGWESPQIFGTIIDTLGERIDSFDIHISSGLENKECYFPACSFDGNNYLVVWYAYDNYELFQLYGRRISPDGNLIDPSPVKISLFMPFPFIDPYTSPSISFDGNYYLIVFEGIEFEEKDLYAIRITPSMQVIDQNPIKISDAYDWQWYPSSVYKNGYHFVVWSDQRNGLMNIYGARVTPEGNVVDPDGIMISSYNSWFPSVSADADNYFVAWHDWREGGEPLIYGARVSPSGTVIDPNGIKFSNSNLRQMYAKIKYGSYNYLSIWEDYRNLYMDIYGTRVNPQGFVLDPDGLRISASANFHFNPKCSFDGNNYLIVWEDWREENGNFSDIYGIRIDPYGNILHPVSFPVSQTGNWIKVYPSIASSDINYLVVWSDTRNGNWDIYGVRLDFSGNRIDPLDIPVSKKWSIQYYPQVAYGGNYFIVWEDTRDGDFNSIYGARMNKFGHIIDTGGIKVSINTNTFKITPSICYGGGKYLLVWTDIKGDSSGHYWYSVVGTRLNQNGEIIDSGGIIIADAGVDSFGFEDHFGFPSCAFSGENYLIAYNRFEYIGNYFLGFDIFFTIIDTMGNVIRKKVPITAYNSYDQMFPAVVFDGENYFIVWQDERGGTFDIYGARVTQTGQVMDPDGFPVISSPFLRATPSLAKGPSDEIFISYQGFLRENFYSYRTLGYIYHSISIYESCFNSNFNKLRLFISPNPFKENTTILIYGNFKNEKNLIFSLFDLSGRIIRRLPVDEIQRGIYRTVWNGRDEKGSFAPPGTYFGVLNLKGKKLVSKILKIK